LVWFQLDYWRQYLRKRIAFNPILVWFQLSVAYKPSSLILTFQSHFGLISTKFENRICVNRILSIFQSHFGLISTFPLNLSKSSSESIFQSHFGLISTEYMLKIKCSESMCLSIPFWSDFNSNKLKSMGVRYITFNPILVWFQPSLASPPLVSPCHNFQSHFGLISTIRKYVEAPAIIFLFQSHFGLISTIGNAVPPLMAYRPFNPILVWFQHSVSLPQRSQKSTFNPILVWFQLARSSVNTS